MRMPTHRLPFALLLTLAALATASIRLYLATLLNPSAPPSSPVA